MAMEIISIVLQSLAQYKHIEKFILLLNGDAKHYRQKLFYLFFETAILIVTEFHLAKLCLQTLDR